MRVLVDALSVHFGGGLTFALEQLVALRRIRPDIDLEVLVAPWNLDSLGPPLTAAGATVEEVHLGSLPQRWTWQETVLPRRARRADVLYAPGNFLPLMPVGRPTVVCQQNPNYTAEARTLPHNRPAGRRLRIAQAYRSMRVATRVVVVAHWMLRSLVHEIPSLARRGVVIHSGVPGWPSPAQRPAGVGDAPFFLVLSNDAPHKDLDLLVEGWGRAAAAHSGLADLVLAGDLGPRRVADHARSVPPGAVAHLHHLGAVRDRAEVRWLLDHARAMVSASRLESCPLTVLEARSRGCPLVLAETPSHLEAAAEVARFFPAGDAEALGAALRCAPVRGDAHLTWTTWDQHARRLGDVLDDAVAAPS